MKLSPNMRLALTAVGRHGWARTPDLPGGHSTERALIKRGLVERDGSRLILTMAGRREVQR